MALLSALAALACVDHQPTQPQVQAPFVLVGAGDIADCRLPYDEMTAALLDSIPGGVFTLGDNAYPNGTLEEFQECYEPTWGRHLARTRPAAGNHDYGTPGAAGYFAYFGAAAGDPLKGYYSYDAGSWKVIVLNSNIARGASSPQVAWLVEELRAAGEQCVVAMWHYPLFTSAAGRTSLPSIRPFWDTLYAYGADLVLVGHDHLYERYAPMRPDGTLDREFGMRQLTHGAGGASLYSFGTIHPNSEVRIAGAHGLLKLTLDEDKYGWEFVPVGGGAALTDSGTDACHGRPGGEAP